MIKKLTSSNYKNKIGLATSAFLIMNMVVIMSDCGSSPDGPNVFIADPDSGIDYTMSTPPADVPSKNVNADITELAEFAWQEFIALNWPVVTSGRAAPDTGNSFLAASKVGSSYTPVWQTYWHRNELLPGPGKTPVTPSITDTAPPNYQYKETYPYGGSGTGDYTLWNNLDEINELGQDVVFAHSIATPPPNYTDGIDSTYQVLYEAKMNFSGSNYIFNANLNDANTRAAKVDSTVANLAALSKAGGCETDPKYVCLPCGKLANGSNPRQEGNIEIKAGWRVLTSAEASSGKFHTQNVIYYHNVDISATEVESKYFNATMGLVGLHIIHKTETFPDFVYATWEHVDNLEVDPTTNKRAVYAEIQNTNFGDDAKTSNDILRTHPIPSSITSVNETVASVLSDPANNSVWQYYKLINVQAKPMDVHSVKSEDESSFYLSNSVIESNIELQTFTGSLTDSSVMNVFYEGNEMNMGGCMGCHGNAQLKGADFNFLIATGAFPVPEFTGRIEPGCPPGDEGPTTITYWTDVQNLLNKCAVETSIGRSPHKYFWDDATKTVKENYCVFTTMDAPGTGTKICTPGDSKTSKIIEYLTSHFMPGGGGPYFTDEQIAGLATWIDNGCIYDAGNTYKYTDCQ
jgi:hypothetical protein